MKSIFTNESPQMKYMLMSRLVSDVKYCLQFKCFGKLYFQDPKEHAEEMQRLYKILPEQPEWLSRKELNKLCKKLVMASLNN